VSDTANAHKLLPHPPLNIRLLLLLFLLMPGEIVAMTTAQLMIIEKRKQNARN